MSEVRQNFLNKAFLQALLFKYLKNEQYQNFSLRCHVPRWRRHFKTLIAGYRLASSDEYVCTDKEWDNLWESRGLPSPWYPFPLFGLVSPSFGPRLPSDLLRTSEAFPPFTKPPLLQRNRLTGSHLMIPPRLSHYSPNLPYSKGIGSLAAICFTVTIFNRPGVAGAVL